MGGRFDSLSAEARRHLSCRMLVVACRLNKEGRYVPRYLMIYPKLRRILCRRRHVHVHIYFYFALAEFLFQRQLACRLRGWSNISNERLWGFRGNSTLRQASPLIISMYRPCTSHRYSWSISRLHHSACCEDACGGREFGSSMCGTAAGKAAR